MIPIRRNRKSTIQALILCLLLPLIGCVSSQTGSLRPSAEPAPPIEIRFDELWDYAKPVKSETAFLALLPRYPANETPLIRAELLSQIARSQGLQGRFNEAHRRLDEARKLIAKRNSVARIRYWLERGRLENSAQKPDLARPLFMKAFRLALTLNTDFYTIDAAHMLAIVEAPDMALEWNLLALQLAENSLAPLARRWQGSLLNNLGWTYFDKGRYDRALEAFEKALAFRLEQGKTKPIRIARWSVARSLRSLGRGPEALAIQQRLDRELTQAGERDGFVYEELALGYAAMGKTEQARLQAGRAYRELKDLSWFVESEPTRLERLKTLMNGDAAASDPPE